ncbi:MAG: c-type cytochrome [Planctomycetes bacterium]|nr:c-type cytochrome [Planctomycetota bacterium]
MRRSLALLAACVLAATATAQPKPPDAPVSADKRLVVEPFAAAPDIVHPIALDFDAKGRLLVVESHTHFRPANYGGPKFDRIRTFVDTDGDGKADKITTFYEGTTHTMDMAVHPDGSVYVATRNEIIRLRDTKGTGAADERTRIAFLDTKGNYPHNGLCGLSFDSKGDLNFGIGENLGEPYTLTGADGTALTGGGEGGNVYHCSADGKKLRRVATGFWNPFGSCRDIYGRLFVVDNDPDASPPCRLLHVVEGGDYGFQFRYGRAGRHPFQAWNGELPGTLPMVAGTGESPCEVVSYESDGLPEEYRGELLVPAWADHRVERYTLKPKGASVTAERKPFVQGGKDFYPSGLTVAPDGSLFVTDWGSRSYELHGKGAIWHIKWKDAKPAARPKEPKEAILSADRKTREAAARELAKAETGRAALRKELASNDVRVRAAALTALIETVLCVPELGEIARNDPDSGMREFAARNMAHTGFDAHPFVATSYPPAVRTAALAALPEATLLSDDLLLKFLTDPDPFLRHAGVMRLAKTDNLLAKLDPTTLKPAQARTGVLLAWRASGHRDAPKHLADFLADADPDVRFLAVKWVSDEKLTAFRPQIAEMLKGTGLDPRSYVAVATALARIDGKPVNENSLAEYFLERLNDKAAPTAARLMALRAIPATHKALRTERLVELLKADDAALRIEALRALKDRADAKSAPAVRAIATNEKEPPAVRAQAVVTLSATETDVDFLLGLAGAAEPVVQEEALRALTGAKLTDKQQSALLKVVGKPGRAADLVNRVLGKPANADRPWVTKTDAWLQFLEGKADPDAGRRVFESPKLAGCFKCHQVEGRGANIGPDLSLVGRTERKWIVESILQPSAVVAPHYQAWKIELTDGRNLTGLLVGTHLDRSVYIDEKGNRFEVLAGDVAEVRAAKNSIMPDGLLGGLTDQEVRDLVAYLAARK